MSSFAILTHDFPFAGGEQFLETEIEYLRPQPFPIVLLPLRTSGPRRPVPEWVVVDESIARDSTRWRLALACMAATVSPVLWSEISLMRGRKVMRVASVWSAFKTAARVHWLRPLLANAAQRHGGFSTIYSYWSDVELYAAVLCKHSGLAQRVIARGHGFDVYEDRARAGYMPLKRALVPEVDVTYVVSQSGADYYARQFGADPAKVKVSRLGVRICEHIARPSAPNNVHVVSISSCVPIKRLDRIMEGLEILAHARRDLSIQWTHLGGGPGLELLQKEAAARLGQHKQVNVNLLGKLDHAEVLRFLCVTPIDILLNTSSSEGVPVSIMEAMSCGIPAVAPCVGGVPEVVSTDCGRLLSQSPDGREVAATISEFLPIAKLPQTRRQAKQEIAMKYNADVNYPEFFAEIGLRGHDLPG